MTYFNSDGANKPVTMTKKAEKKFWNATEFWLYEKPLSEKDKVRGHCHPTGDHRRAAHDK